MPLIPIIIGVILFGLAYWVITEVPLPPPMKRILTVVLVVIFVIWLISLLTGFGGVYLHVR